MATITQRGNKYRAQVRIKGVSRSATFERHADAKAWAARMESQVLDGIQGNANRNMYFGDIARRYLETVTPLKRGAQFESYRIGRVLKTGLANIRLDDLRPQHFADWRDMRLKEVSESSVNRELSTLSAICTHAMKEWGLLRDNPVQKISKPKKAKARSRRPSESEIQAICKELMYSPDSKPELGIQRIAAAFLFAIETAMRAGEICGLNWPDVDFNRRLAHLRITKNGDSRDVPLSSRAIEILKQLKGIHPEKVFNLDSHSLDVQFRRARDKLGIVDLHFHDSRREALTRMSKKVPVEVLAKISGHRDLRILLNVYYRPDMAEIASMLD
ncbi:site-specific integrase [Neisseria weixii]|uniref:Site-specific integrase n=1 Tax=Neisseria weixii TaxID=1853276 RepID=A0A3N4NQ92_9NEIS|nr:site-specific integrase [Neisseria weixii]RPD86258.1 site-specific integrase [Neisseria weixii]RPD89423.1 site-specific integrase [Neisseria weixii]